MKNIPIIVFSLLLISCRKPPTSTSTTFLDYKPHELNYMRVLYDATSSPINRGATGWGFSADVNFEQTRFLLDVGQKDSVLERNFNTFNVDPQDMEFLVVSLYHEGHLGGISAVLRENPDMRVYVPSERVKKRVGRSAVLIKKERKIKEGIWLVNTSHRAVDFRDEDVSELSVVLETQRGLVVLVGCGYPGITLIVKRIRQIFPDEVIYLLAGGFHMIDFDEEKIRAKGLEFLRRGVANVSANHCSGPLAEEVLGEIFGADYIPTGVGATILFPSS